MKPVFEKIRRLSKPFLETRNNDVHTENDMIVKEADKLRRYSRSGFYIYAERFGESHEKGLERLRFNISGWFLR